MGTAERRYKILRTLCRRRFETIGNLAVEFGVSERTIQRDIDVLGTSAPIYTQCGRYGGGVYAMDTLRVDWMYMTDSECAVLRKLRQFAKARAPCLLDTNEQDTLDCIIKEYTKNDQKGKKHEQK